MIQTFKRLILSNEIIDKYYLCDTGSRDAGGQKAKRQFAVSFVWYPEVQICRESLIRNSQLRKMRFSFVHSDWVHMQSGGRRESGLIGALMEVRWGFKSHSHPFYHLDSPIRAEPCQCHTSSNDTNTWPTHRAALLIGGDLKGRLMTGINLDLDVDKACEAT